MAVVIDPVFGPKPSMTLLGGSPSSLSQGSVPFIPSGGRSVTLVSGQLRTVSFAHIYRTQPIAGATIRRMSEAIARLPLNLFRYLDAAGDTRERDRVHAAARLLNRPRPRQRGVHLRWDMALSMYVHGNYVGFKRRPSRGAPPFELWTLDWRLLTPIMDGQRVLGWRWHGDGVPGLQREDVILIEDTVHIGFMAPGGGELAVSPLEQLGVTVRSEDALQRYAEAAMRNGTRFGVAVILDPKVKADAALRNGVREEVEDAHGGIDQAFRSPVLGGGITDIKPLGQQSAVEAELIQQRKVNANEFAAVIGIPAPLAGIALETTNYAALRELHRILYVTALAGPLELMLGSLQAQVLDSEAAWDRDDRFMEWNLDVALRGDAKERWDTYKVGVEFGGLVLNDVRRKENLKPYDDPRAEEPLIAANNVRPLRDVGVDGTNVIDGNRAATNILELVAQHAGRALERAARGAGAGRGILAALDVDRVARELTIDLEALELNGTSGPLARALADDLEHLLADAQTVDDVRQAAAAYPLTAGDPDQ